MTTEEISKALTDKGAKGVKELVDKRIKRNDIGWAIAIFLICTIFIGFYCTKQDESNLSAFKEQKVKECNQFQDSLVSFCNAEYNVTKRVKQLNK